MGEGALAGMPLQLAGTRQILEYMDWGDYGAMETFIKIGAIGKKMIRYQIRCTVKFHITLLQYLWTLAILDSLLSV